MRCSAKSGTIDNPAYLPVLYYADTDADWSNRKLWKAVNPALGDFIEPSFLEEEYKIAVDLPSRARTFKVLYLNMPVDEQSAWCDMARYDKCKDKLPKLDGCRCWGGLDLAPVRDLSAFSLVFQEDGKYLVRSWFWCNEDDIIERSKYEGVPNDVWHEQGYITACHGSTTDFEHIKRDVLEINQLYNIKSNGVDVAHAFQLAQELQAEGLPVEWFRQGFMSFSPPMKMLEKLMMDKTITIEPNPVLDYCFSNVIAEYDANENIRPSNKLKRREDKIDGAVAVIQALGMSMKDTKPSGSVFETEVDAAFWL